MEYSRDNTFSRMTDGLADSVTFGASHYIRGLADAVVDTTMQVANVGERTIGYGAQTSIGEDVARIGNVFAKNFEDGVVRSEGNEQWRKMAHREENIVATTAGAVARVGMTAAAGAAGVALRAAGGREALDVMLSTGRSVALIGGRQAYTQYAGR